MLALISIAFVLLCIAAAIMAAAGIPFAIHRYILGKDILAGLRNLVGG